MKLTTKCFTKNSYIIWKKKKIDCNILKWIAIFYQWKINNHSHVQSHITIVHYEFGVFQDFSISFIVYFVYNADLMQKDKKFNFMNLNYINNISKFKIKFLIEQNNRNLKTSFMTKKQKRTDTQVCFGQNSFFTVHQNIQQQRN